MEDTTITAMKPVEGKLKAKDARILGKFKGEITAREPRVGHGAVGRRRFKRYGGSRWRVETWPTGAGSYPP